MNIFNLLLATLLCLSCSQAEDKKDDLNWTQPNLEGHWRLYDTEIVKEVPFLNLQAPGPDEKRMVKEDGPWDSYTAYDLVIERDTFYRVTYPIQAKAPAQYFLDSGYIHVNLDGEIKAYPVELVHDTLILYSPVPEFGFFKETYVATHFNDSILNVMKKFEVNYPELAGTWMLVREEDYDYGTHYELNFPHKLPNSIKFTRQQMIAALTQEKIYMMRTDGINRDYSFSYSGSSIYFRPGKWYQGEEDPGIHFYRE